MRRRLYAFGFASIPLASTFYLFPAFFFGCACVPLGASPYLLPCFLFLERSVRCRHRCSSHPSLLYVFFFCLLVSLLIFLPPLISFTSVVALLSFLFLLFHFFLLCLLTVALCISSFSLVSPLFVSRRRWKGTSPRPLSQSSASLPPLSLFLSTIRPRCLFERATDRDAHRAHVFSLACT